MNFQFAQKSHAFCHALEIPRRTRDSGKKHGKVHGIDRKKHGILHGTAQALWDKGLQERAWQNAWQKRNWKLRF